MDPTPAADSAAHPPATARPLQLSILLALIVALNALGVIRGVAMRDDVMRAIPKFTPLLFGLWTGSQVAAVLGAIGLWFLLRGGLYLLALAWAVAAFVDIRLGATGHAILVTGIFWLVVLFVRPVRAALR